MAVYRYSPELIEPLASRVRNRHSAYFLVFVGVVCLAGYAVLNLSAALILNAAFVLLGTVVHIRSRESAYQRTVEWLRSTELEVSENEAILRSMMSETAIQRLEVGEAYFSEKTIWLRRRSSSARLQVSPEFETFPDISKLLKAWLPPNTMIRSTPPSNLWNLPQLLGSWIAAPALLYVAMVSKSRAIGIPASMVAAIGIAWYFAWCGRNSSERKWQVLLPTTGYAVALILGLRAFSLWVLP